MLSQLYLTLFIGKMRDLMVSMEEGESRGDFHDSTIVYSINNESLISNMEYYIISCVNDTCPTQNVTENSGVFTIPSSDGDCIRPSVNHTFNIYGVNRCGVRSNIATTSVTTEVNSGMYLYISEQGYHHCDMAKQYH